MSIPPGISVVLLPRDDLNVIDLVDFTISSIGTKSAPDLLATGMTDSKLFLKTASLITSKRIASEHVIFFFGNLLVTYGNLHPFCSVAAAQSWCFAIFVNKFCKIMKIFEKLDHLKSWWVLCQH